MCLLLLKQQDFLPDGNKFPSIGFAYNAIQLSKDNLSHRKAPSGFRLRSRKASCESDRSGHSITGPRERQAAGIPSFLGILGG